MPQTEKETTAVWGIPTLFKIKLGHTAIDFLQRTPHDPNFPQSELFSRLKSFFAF